MNAIDVIRMSLEMSQNWVMGLAADMKDAPLTAPTPLGGNHPLWCVGHLAYAEGNLVQCFIRGKEHPLAHWEGIFGPGTQPSGDASHYPSFAEAMVSFQQMRDETMALLDTLTDEDLDKPSHAPEEMKDWFGTVGQCFVAIPIHIGFHGGQVADARRAAGRDPVMG